MLTETPIQAEAPAAQSAAFVLTGVKRTYMRDSVAVEALRGIDLTIHRGEYLVIEGPSGSGKSTLLQLLGMLDKPTEGTVSCDGASTGDLSESELAELRLKKIGFIFQQFNLIPTLTAKQNVEIAMFPTDRDKDESATRALELLATVGLADRADHFPSQLSGGEQQRVAITRALANEPEILLADEPTGNLDTQTGNEILATIRQLWSAGLTVVLITHDRSIAAEATRRLLLRDGAIEAAEDAPAS